MPFHSRLQPSIAIHIERERRPKRVHIIWVMILLVQVQLAVFANKVPGSSSNDGLASRVDQLFERWDAPESPGAAVAVIKDGAIVYTGYYGSSNLEYGIPISSSSVFNIASVSKQFTAFAILLLANEGKLSLEDDIRKHVAEVPDFGQRITIRHLIHHTSGLRGIWSLFELMGLRLNDDVTTTNDVLALVKNQRELNFKPSEEFLYCNTGYALLAVIVERVSGMSLRAFAKERIFKPLGMAHTHFHNDREMIVKNRTYAYRADNDSFKKMISNNEIVGNGHLFTTLEDLAKWVINFQTGTVGGAAAFKQMQERGVLHGGERIHYAFGLTVDTYLGLERIGHNGAHAGYRSNLSYFPREKLGIIVLSNLASLNPSTLTRQVADVYLGKTREARPQANQSSVSLGDYELAQGSLENFNAFLGHYSLSQGTVYRRIYRKEGIYFYHRGGENESELVPLKDGRLLMRGVRDEWMLSATKTKPNAPKQLRWFRNGTFHSLLEAYDPWFPKTQALTEFAGSFYSQELKTTLVVNFEKGRLLLKRPRHEATKLTPRMQDRFNSELGTVFYERDENHGITGLRITTSGVRNLLFERSRKP